MNTQNVFNNQESPPLDCIIDKNNNILTNPSDIANEIHTQQTINNSPQYSLAITNQNTCKNAHVE